MFKIAALAAILSFLPFGCGSTPSLVKGEWVLFRTSPYSTTCRGDAWQGTAISDWTVGCATSSVYRRGDCVTGTKTTVFSKSSHGC